MIAAFNIGGVIIGSCSARFLNMSGNIVSEKLLPSDAIRIVARTSGADAVLSDISQS
jgi:hypothetical protein